MRRKKSWSGRRNPKKWCFWSLSCLIMFSVGIHENKQIPCDKSCSIYFVGRHRKHQRHSSPQSLHFSNSSQSALTYSQPEHTVGLNVLNADNSPSDKKHLDGNHSAVSSGCPFCRVPISCHSPHSPRTWVQGLRGSVGCPAFSHGDIMRYYWQVEKFWNHLFSHLSGWARKKHNLSHHNYKVWDKNWAAMSFMDLQD